MLRTALFLAIQLTAVACAPATAEMPSQDAPYRQVHVAQLKDDLTAGRVPLLLDVRTPAEFADGHVPGARNVPLADLKSRLGELADHKDGEVYVICHSGNRSQSAARQLLAAGYKPVDVLGGTNAWKSAWYDVQ